MTDPTNIQLVALILLILTISIWELVWKLIGMWKASRNSQQGWFVVMGIFNTVGILPLIYITFFQRKPKNKYGRLKQ